MITIITPYGECPGDLIYGLIRLSTGDIAGRFQIEKKHWEAFKLEMAKIINFTQGFN